MPVANARMYSATPVVKAAWKDVLAWVLARAGLDWQTIDYDAPAPLNALWARDDLGLAMMCGLPYSQRSPKPLLLAAPVPSPARYGGKPVYMTDVVVRADAGYRSIEETFGGVVGYTLADSMSGGVAFARFLSGWRAVRGGRLYRGAVGNLIHARGVIEALADGRIDVGPLDSYYHDLLRANDPGFAAQVRVIASTAPMPIPPLVATAPLAAAEADRLRHALAEVGSVAQLEPQRRVLLLAGFALPPATAYEQISALAREPAGAFEEL
ncbi:MAG: PhnD/SsuA/transferrin family substrate-binding protein [Gemmatimonadetes bacterium]|nr:PhnD/SsuA/transferrin family substrate-binding protein [Gemmatimonadota bacterium]